ncbi:MAG TPA: hypothetical protein ENN41_10290, partial [Sediminispirochaeta sp.]|nr:hypothetical protein [Sediminispirochaeta sp.]
MNKMKFLGFFVLVVSFFLVCILAATAQDFDYLDRSVDEEDEFLAFDFIGTFSGRYLYPLMEGQAPPKSLYDEVRAAMDYRSPHLDILIDWAMKADGKYSEEEPYLGGRYFYMYDTHMKVDYEPFSFKAGRGPHRDAVDSPYSVFINSVDIPALHMELGYESGYFFYNSRWIQLTSNSSQYYYGFSPEEVGETGYDSPYSDDDPNTLESPLHYLDKGANYKSFGIKLGDWRVGFQDVVIYLDRVFDPEYFLNPMPQYFVQLITTEDGRPWAQQGNTKSMMGFFADRRTFDTYGMGQILIDDINGDFIPGYSISPAIKTKMAWSLGGFKDFSFGRVGLYHAGATKYTFQATSTAHHTDRWGAPGFIDIPYSILPYDATYTSGTEFTLKDGGQAPIDYSENYLSYKYGENNLAFMADYQSRFFPGTDLEFGLY